MAAAGGKLLKRGQNQVFLPSALITLIRPKAPTPHFATFKVPLRFNKLDIRDYLQHAYGVGTLGVRSMLQRQNIRRSVLKGGRKWRPPPIKTMTVELARPFVWPAPPEDKTPWIPEREARSEKFEKRNRSERRHIQRTGQMRLRDEKPIENSRAMLRNEAARLLRGEGPRWSNGDVIDPRFGAPPGGETGLAVVGSAKAMAKRERRERRAREAREARESDVD